VTSQITTWTVGKDISNWLANCLHRKCIRPSVCLHANCWRKFRRLSERYYTPSLRKKITITIIVVVFQGLGLFACYGFRTYFSETYESTGQLVWLLGRGIGPTQGLYLHRTTQQKKKTQKHVNASYGIWRKSTWKNQKKIWETLVRYTKNSEWNVKICLNWQCR
jgi:hypothetical protein